MNEQALRQLLEKYQRGECNPAERARVEQWYAEKATDPSGSSFVSDEEIRQDLAEIRRSLPHHTPQTIGRPRTYHRMVAAAIALVFVSLGLLLYIQHRPNPSGELALQDFAPGTHVAQLNLANGRSLNLEEVTTGNAYQIDGMEVRKTEEGEITYVPMQQKHPSDTWNEIVTPRGGQFKIVLEDGTGVWLNAASTLRFPPAFGDDGRVVELEGEAYFEVANDQRRPFSVKSTGQTIRVLGTRFNVKGYADEPYLTTTLLSGSVKIESEAQPRSYTLKPGQQIKVGANGTAEMRQVDPSEALAWKNGLFKFDGVGIEEALRQYARWYDVEIQYEGEIPDAELFGETSRKSNASQALEMLNFFGLDYQIVNEGRSRTIKITKNR